MTTVPPNPDEPTEAVPTGAFDPTIAQPAVAAAPPNGPGSAGGGGNSGDSDGRSKRGLIIALVVLGVLVVLLAVGLVVVLVADNDRETATTTTSTTVPVSSTTAPASTSTTSGSVTTTKGTSATTTTSTAPSTKPAFTSLSVPSTYDCPGSEFVTLSWATKNATQVTISIDGPGIYASYAASGSAQVPFACGDPKHTYIIRAIGPDGTVEQTRVITRV